MSIEALPLCQEMQRWHRVSVKNTCDGDKRCSKTIRWPNEENERVIKVGGAITLSRDNVHATAGVSYGSLSMFSVTFLTTSLQRSMQHSVQRSIILMVVSQLPCNTI